MKIDDLIKNVEPGSKQSIDLDLALDKVLPFCNTFRETYEYEPSFLYRGRRSAAPDIFIGKPHTSRIPLDSSENMSMAFNELLKRENIAARRDNSIFVTSDKTLAEEYTFRQGSIYIIIPIDPFKYTWSKTTKDLVLGSSFFQRTLDTAKAHELYKAIFENEKVKNAIIYDLNIPDELQSIRYVGQRNRVGKGNYGFLSAKWFEHTNIIREAAKQGKIPSNFYDMADPVNLLSWEKIDRLLELQTNTNLVSAIDKGHEVWIHGSYLAIDSLLESQLRKKLLELGTPF